MKKLMYFVLVTVIAPLWYQVFAGDKCFLQYNLYTERGLPAGKNSMPISCDFSYGNGICDVTKIERNVSLSFDIKKNAFFSVPHKMDGVIFVYDFDIMYDAFLIGTFFFALIVWIAKMIFGCLNVKQCFAAIIVAFIFAFVVGWAKYFSSMQTRQAAILSVPLQWAAKQVHLQCIAKNQRKDMK